MIPMVYQGVMQYHRCPGVLHNTNGLPGCYAVPLLSWSIAYQWCARVLRNTTVVPECYAIPLLTKAYAVPVVLGCYIKPLVSLGCYTIPLLSQPVLTTPLLSQGVSQFHRCPTVFCGK